MSDSNSAIEPCPRCGKSRHLCVCDGIVAIDNKIEVLILRHPQEQDVELGTARLATLHLKHALLKTGLSWPSLAAALDKPADPKRWGVLYLGSVNSAELAPGREIVAIDRKGAALPDQDSLLSGLTGVIALDGTWSQAKALWWRNAWMLKCQRLVLGPRTPSRYGNLRKEPRRDGLSTIESVALLLSRLEKKPEIESALTVSFERLLEKYRLKKPSRARVDRRKGSFRKRA